MQNAFMAIHKGNVLFNTVIAEIIKNTIALLHQVAQARPFFSFQVSDDRCETRSSLSTSLRNGDSNNFILRYQWSQDKFYIHLVS